MATVVFDDTGGSGNYQLFGGGGDALLFGEASDDTVRAGQGNDVASGGAGSDFVKGAKGADTLIYILGNHIDEFGHLLVDEDGDVLLVDISGYTGDTEELADLMVNYFVDKNGAGDFSELDVATVPFYLQFEEFETLQVVNQDTLLAETPLI